MIYDFASQASYAVTLNPKITKNINFPFPISYLLLKLSIQIS